MIARLAACLTVVTVVAMAPSAASAADAQPCDYGICSTSPSPTVTPSPGALQIEEEATGAAARAFLGKRNAPAGPVRHDYQVLVPCTSAQCVLDDQTCPPQDGRRIVYRIVQARPVVQADGSAVDGLAPPAGATPGTPYGAWRTVFTGCVDITALDPGPTPEEVFRYFRTLPLPVPTSQQQPPGNALVGLPVIFFTDSPRTATYTLDIRGYTVVITATVTTWTWTTGDGNTLTSRGPGAPYPDQTITHDYHSGTYTAQLATTWSGTFTVNGGPATPVTGTTTTTAAPVTFTVLQARPQLIAPTN